MTKTNKIIYFIVSLIFLIFFNIYLTDFILNFTGEIHQNPLFNIIYVENYGASFNIFNGLKAFLILFASIAFVSIISYTLKHIKSISAFCILCLSTLCSGIFCNMLERLLFGYVRDFIKLNFINFPVFNISDIFINISVFAILCMILKKNYFKRNENNN